MRISKWVAALFIVSLITLPFQGSVFAGEHGGSTVHEHGGSQATAASDVGLTIPGREPGSSKTMAEFVDEYTYGKERSFTDDDVMTLMRAYRELKDIDRKLSREVERIAAKMANL